MPLARSQLRGELANNAILLPIGGVNLQADSAQVIAKIFQRINLSVKSNRRPEKTWDENKNTRASIINKTWDEDENIPSINEPLPSPLQGSNTELSGAACYVQQPLTY